MTAWRLVPEERLELYSPIGLRLLDELTGAAPAGAVHAFLDRGDSPNVWISTDIKPVRTPGGVVAYPGLGRTSQPAGKPPVNYRVRLEADYYIPLYRATAGGIPFAAYPYNDSLPPQVITGQPPDALLAPAPNYPFPSHVPVVRGKVVDQSNTEVSDVLVMWANQERVITSERGVFALPLRLAANNTPITIDAIDQRTGRSGNVTITPPADLRKSWTITIS